MIDHLDNPVARAHHRDRPGGHGDTLAGRVLLWAVVVPTIVALVSNPFGWLVLLLVVLGLLTLAPALAS